MLYITYQHILSQKQIMAGGSIFTHNNISWFRFQGTLPAAAKPLWTVLLTTVPLLFLDFLRPQKLESLYPKSSFMQLLCVPHKSKWKLITAPLLFSKTAMKHMTLEQNVKYVRNSIFDWKICAFRTSKIKILSYSAGHLQKKKSLTQPKSMYIFRVYTMSILLHTVWCSI